MDENSSLSDFGGDAPAGETGPSESDDDAENEPDGDAESDPDAEAESERSSETESEQSDDADAALDATADATVDAPAVDPAVSTYRWSPAGAACADCGESVERSWLDGEEYVCGDCKEW